MAVLIMMVPRPRQNQIRSLNHKTVCGVTGWRARGGHDDEDEDDDDDEAHYEETILPRWRLLEDAPGPLRSQQAVWLPYVHLGGPERLVPRVFGAAPMEGFRGSLWTLPGGASDPHSGLSQACVF